MLQFSKKASPNLKLSDSSLKRLHYLLLAIAVFICCIPFATYYITRCHDIGYLLFRLEGIAKGFAAGEFPPRMHTSQLQGYGYPAGITFPDLFLYPFALLRVVGLGVNNTYRLLFVCLTAATAVVSYESFRRISGRNVAIVATLLWMFAPYRNADVLLRADFGEATALIFLPLFALGVYRIVWSPTSAHLSGGRQTKGWLLCGIAMSGIIYSNLCVTVIMIAFAMPIAIVLAVANGRLLELAKGALKAALLVILLTAAYTVPLIDYHMNAQLAYKSGFGSMTREYMEGSATQPAQLFLLFAPLGSERVYLTPGWALLGAAICVVLALAMPEIRGKSGKHLQLSAIVLLVSVAFVLFACTKLFPWDTDLGLLNPLLSFLANLQFPWRLLGLISFLLVICSVFALVITKDTVAATLRCGVAAALVALALLECGVCVSSFLYFGQEVDTNDILSNDSGVYDAQFIPSNVDLNKLEGALVDEPIPQDGLDVVEFSRQGSRVTLSVRSQSKETKFVDLPLLFYRYVSIISATPANPSCSLSVGNNGVVRLMVPGEYEGVLEVGFVAPAYWRVAEMTSLLTLCALVVFSVRNRINGAGPHSPRHARRLLKEQ